LVGACLGGAHAKDAVEQIGSGLTVGRAYSHQADIQCVLLMDSGFKVLAAHETN
jgi:hypothetical protein